MSASALRTQVETWCGEVAVTSRIPFHPTINTGDEVADDVWFTVEYGTDDFEGTFCEKGYLENGFIRVVVMAPAGNGWKPAVTAMETIIPLLYNKVDPMKKVVLERYEPLQEGTNGTADSDYMVSVIIDYVYSL